MEEDKWEGIVQANLDLIRALQSQQTSLREKLVAEEKRSRDLDAMILTLTRANTERSGDLKVMEICKQEQQACISSKKSLGDLIKILEKERRSVKQENDKLLQKFNDCNKNAEQAAQKARAKDIQSEANFKTCVQEAEECYKSQKKVQQNANKQADAANKQADAANKEAENERKKSEELKRRAEIQFQRLQGANEALRRFLNVDDKKTGGNAYNNNSQRRAPKTIPALF
jgi:hypothetical protein